MMTTRDYWYSMTEAEQHELAERLETGIDYLRKIMTRHRQAGPKLARRLGEETPYTAADWRPDIFGPRHAA
jgi:hypothetical protein